MGRPRKPVHLKVLDDTYQESKDGKLAYIPQPKPVARIGPPDDLGVAGNKFWNDHFDELERLQLLTEVDLPQFYELCLLMDRIAECQEIMSNEGAWYLTDKGNLLRHPASLQRDKYVAEKMALIRQFGLTPAARNTLQIMPKGQKKVATRKRG